MNIASIKWINERTPYWVKKPFTKIIRNKLIGNELFQQTYALLQEADKWADDQIEKWQQHQLKNCLEYAYSHSAYYKNLFDRNGILLSDDINFNELNKIPILVKENIVNSLMCIASKEELDYYEVMTGGSSGVPMKVLMEKTAIYKEWAFVYHYWSKFGYDYKSSRLATFRGASMGNCISEINPLYAEIRMNPFIMNEKNIHLYIHKIDDYGADFVYGYPSAIYNFCRLIKKTKTPLTRRFKAALLISENLYPFQEKLITETLQCKIAIFYGHSERAVFAEKYKEGYRFNPLYGITEITPKGELIVTGFINGKTPLIRYLLDDAVELVKKSEFEDSQIPTKIVNFNDYYRIIGHRDSDVIYGKNGEQFRVSLLNFHGSLMEEIGYFQFQQNHIGEVILFIETPVIEEKVTRTREKISHILGDAFILEIKQVNQLKVTNRGKYKLLIQNVNLNESK